MSKELLFFDPKIIRRLESVDADFRKLKVSFDMDGVEINSAELAIGNLNNKLGTNHVVDDLIGYWTMVDLVSKADPSIQDPKKYATDLWNNDNVFGNAKPDSGAWILANYLNRIGINNISRITSRPSFVKDVTLNWYKTKMPWVKQESIYIQDNALYDPDYKVKKIIELGIDLHFEDSVDEAEKIVSQTNARVVLVPQFWNQEYIFDGNWPKGKILIPHRDWRTPAKMVHVYIGLEGMI